MSTRLADRVQRARHESLCPICRCVITPGMQIARLDGVWQHIEHVIDRFAKEK